MSLAGLTRSLIVGAILLNVALAAPSYAYYRRPGSFAQVNVGVGEQAQLPLGKFNCPLGFGPPSMSPSGRFVAFASADGNLVDNDLNRMTDIFVYDRQKKSMTRVSVSSTGVEALGPAYRAAESCDAVSAYPSISANGRYVTFSSDAVNLVDGDTNGTRDVFRHDIRMGQTIRISVSSEGVQSEGGRADTKSSISGDGGVVAFTSAATNLAANDTNDWSDVFLHDVGSGATRRVSLIDGEQTPGVDGRPSITPDGRQVAFTVRAQGVYLYDATTGKSEFVSPPLDVQINPLCASRGPVGSDAVLGVDAEHALSANGRYVVFFSGRPNHVPNDDNACSLSDTIADVFVYDRKTARTERVSVTSAGEQATAEPLNLESWRDASITPNGRWVVYANSSNNLTPEPDAPRCQGKLGCGDDDVFIYDRLTGSTERLSLTADGEEGSCPPVISPGLSVGPVCLAAAATMSRDARRVAFWSDERGFVPADDNDGWDLFTYDRGLDLGGGGVEDPRDGGGQVEPNEGICLVPSWCIPPNGAEARLDGRSDVSEILTRLGANLYGASIAYRPQYEDLFVAIELQDMPSLNVGAAGLFSSAGSPSILYGLRFQEGGASYEVRATSLMGGTFGLFDCTDKTGLACTEVARLRGGFGTTGERVVFSLPLDQIGLAHGGGLADVEAFSSIGTYLTGSARVLDIVGIQ